MTWNTSTATDRSASIVDADSLRAELYHCASMHGTYEQQRRVIEKLETLERKGVLDDFERQAWAHVLTPVADDDWCRKAREAYGRFRTWARKTGRSLEPAFDVRTVTSIVDEDSYDVVKFPVLCVALYADGDLVMVAPSRDPVEEDVFTVPDCLDELADATSTEIAREEVPARN